MPREQLVRYDFAAGVDKAEALLYCRPWVAPPGALWRAADRLGRILSSEELVALLHAKHVPGENVQTCRSHAEVARLAALYLDGFAPHGGAHHLTFPPPVPAEAARGVFGRLLDLISPGADARRAAATEAELRCLLSTGEMRALLAHKRVAGTAAVLLPPLPPQPAPLRTESQVRSAAPTLYTIHSSPDMGAPETPRSPAASPTPPDEEQVAAAADTSAASLAHSVARALERRDRTWSELPLPSRVLVLNSIPATIVLAWLALTARDSSESHRPRL